MNTRTLLTGFGLTLASLLVASPCPAAEVVSLAGTWRFSSEGPWLAEKPNELIKPFAETIELPGTTQTGGKGREFKLSVDQQKIVDEDKVPDFQNPLMGNWTPVRGNLGTAWYQRDVEIPANWAGKRVALTLERTKRTRVWLDGREFGLQDSICVAQVYDLGSLKPGRHVLTILVSAWGFPSGVGGHHLGGMQGNWNGIIGRIELAATDSVWIERVQLQPDVVARKVHVAVFLGNTTRKPIGGELTLSAKSFNSSMEHLVPAQTKKFWPTSESAITMDYDLGRDAQLWDEFQPALYRLKVSLQTGGETTFADEKTVDFGLRDFRRRGTQFVVNGKTVFLRGTHDGASFPLTGYPPMDVDGWVRILKAVKDHGLNHYRFHTWTPPEAAFAAADRVGIYMQPELPIHAGWGFGQIAETDMYALAEGTRMLRAWGNHPSFAMLSLGNEMRSDPVANRPVLTATINYFRTLDSTRLYAEGSNNAFGRPTLNPGDDYWTTMRMPAADPKGSHLELRASFSGGNGWLNREAPSTMRDYANEVKLCPVPLVGHEVGQYTFFPNLDERKKYTGVYRVRNYDIVERRMQRHHVLDRNRAYVEASGQLAILCYREDIEAFLRTPGWGGFQLLDLVDYMGQGTSLVGILDAFHDSKGLIAPEAWREFCCETVPLVRMAKRTWTADETFAADAQVAHYGPAPLVGVTPEWSVKDTAGHDVAAGKLTKSNVTQGTVARLGKIQFALSKVSAPAKLILELRFPGTPYVNHYPLWVYPPKVDTTAPAGIVMVRKLDAALEALAKGGRVVLIPELADIKGCSVPCGFETVFWNFGFASQPPTMGIVCDPKHPLLTQFPTESHSNWQWFWPTTKARAMLLDAAPATLQPLVEVIDNISTCRKLGLIWEARVGAGRLLVCTSDLPALQNQPEGRQLLHSLVGYAASEHFAPTRGLSADTVRQLFASIVPERKGRQGARKDE